MTADLELHLRGLYVNPDRCGHYWTVRIVYLPSSEMRMQCIHCGHYTVMGRVEAIINDLHAIRESVNP